MAENIMGGGYLYGAKPFNVINPGGMSADQSIGTIAGVGEGNRQRALQASEGQKNRNAQAQSDQRNEALQRERMAQEAELAQRQMAQQQAMEERRIKLAEKQAADDQEERLRANRQADFLFQQKLKRDKILRARIKPKAIAVQQGPTPDGGNLGDMDADGDGSITHEDLILRLRENNKTSSELNQRIIKMQVAKTLLDGEETESIASMVEEGNALISAYYTAFTRGASELPSILPDMGLEEVTKIKEEAAKEGVVPLAKSGWMGATAAFGLTAANAARGVVKRMDPMSPTETMTGGAVEGVYESLAGSPATKTEVKKTRLKVDGLASHLAMNAHGKMAVQQAESHMKTLLGALDGFAEGDKTQEAVAAGALQALKDGGADTDMLTDLMARTMFQAGRMGRDARTLASQGKATEKVDKVAVKSAEDHSGRAERIANMAKAISLVKDKDGNPLVQGFGEGGGMFDLYADSYEGGAGKGQDLGKTVKDVFGAIIGSENPAVVITALRDADLSNDPEVGPVVQKMHPKLKAVIIDAAERELKRVQQEFTGAGHSLDELDDVRGYSPQMDRDRIKGLEIEAEGTDQELERMLAESEQERAARLDALDDETAAGLNRK